MLGSYLLTRGLPGRSHTEFRHHARGCLRAQTATCLVLQGFGGDVKGRELLKAEGCFWMICRSS